MEVRNLQNSLKRYCFWLAMKISLVASIYQLVVAILYISDDAEAIDHLPVGYLLNLCL